MSPDQDPAYLRDRVREALRAEPSLREVQMFGGLSFMVDGRLLVAVRGDGCLLVRIDPARSGELLAHPGAGTAEMGAGRTMGPNWVSVAPEALLDEARLAFWIDAARERPVR